jgi:membrane-bound acyltransferase YfiQ involved in biofilm formation
MVRKLLLLNGFSILGVILYHSVGWGFVAMFSWTHRYLPVVSPNYDQIGSLSYFVMRFVEQFVIFTIPAFLFVSGFFIAFATGQARSNIGWGTIRGRIKKMLIPYLIWSFVLFGLMFLQGSRFTPLQYLRMLLTGQTNPAFYYVPLLIQYYLLSPLLVPLAKKYWKPVLIVTGIIQIAVQISYYPAILGLNDPSFQQLPTLIPKWFFPARIFWFTLGVVAGFHLKTLKIWLERYKWYFLVTAIVLIPLGMLEWEWYLRVSGQMWIDSRETFLDSVYTLAFIFSFLAIDKISSVPFSKQIGDLGSKSFGIYITHSPVMEYTARGIYHLAPWIFGYQILFQPILILTGLGIPLLMMAIVNRSPARKYYQYLFG